MKPATVTTTDHQLRIASRVLARLDFDADGTHRAVGRCLISIEYTPDGDDTSYYVFKTHPQADATVSKIAEFGLPLEDAERIVELVASYDMEGKVPALIIEDGPSGRIYDAAIMGPVFFDSIGQFENGALSLN